MPEMTMPKLSDSMEEGTIVAWLVADGEEVAVGDELVEIETDKATMVHEAEHAGVLRTLVPAGEEVGVGVAIASIGDAEPAAAGSAEPAAAEAAQGERTVATPVARRVADDAGLPLAGLAGSGPGGRIRRRDVEAAIESREPAEQVEPAEPAEMVPAAVGPPAPTAKGEKTIVELSRVEERISRRMAESKATIPEFALEAEVECERLLEMRDKLRGASDPAPSLNDLVIKAAAIALRAHPRVNGSYRDGHLELYEQVNVGVAVASDRGLFVPTVFEADRRGLSAIATRVREVAAAVRDGSIAPNDLSGGTFTVSNLGMYGVSSFTAVINPPQAAILAVGAMGEKLKLVDGEVRSVPLMRLTLCCDHRVLDGAAGAEFLRTTRQLLEEPLRMVL